MKQFLLVLSVFICSDINIFGQSTTFQHCTDSVLDSAEVIQREAEKLYEQEDYKRAVDTLSFAINILEKNDLTSSEQYAAIIHDNAMMSLMKHKDAELFEQNIYKAIELQYKLYGISTDYFWSVQCMADGFLYLGKINDFPNNIPLYRKAINTYEYLLENDGKSYMNNYVNALNDYSEAIEHINIDSAIAISRQCMILERQYNLKDSLITLSNMMRQYKENLEYDSAFACANILLNEINNYSFLSKRATKIYEDIASLYGRTKEYQQAISYTNIALGFAKNKYGESSTKYYELLGNLATYIHMCYRNTSRDTSLLILKKIYNSKYGNKLTSSINIAGIYNGKHEEDSCFFWTKCAWNHIKDDMSNEMKNLDGSDRFNYPLTEHRMFMITLPLRYGSGYPNNCFFKRLALESILFYNTIYSSKSIEKPISYSKMLSSLSIGDVAVEIWEDKFGNIDSTKSDYVFIVRKEWESPKIVKLSKTRIINEITDKNKYRRDYNPLYECIWKDIIDSAELKKGEKIFLSIDDSYLEQMPLEYIYNRDWEYMANIYDIRRVSSLVNIKNITDTISLDPIVLYGGLNYEISNHNINDIERSINIYKDEYEKITLSDSIKSELRSTTSFLPWTKYEVDSISSYLLSQKINNIFVLSGDLGTESSFKSLSGKSPKVLHIATHGKLFNQLKLTSPMDAYSFYIYSLEHTSLLFSGVLSNLNGKTTNIEDGFLTSKEIANLDFSNTELLTLSCCDSGLGGITDFGIVGLKQAFKMAGVKTIIMSLSKIDDFETSVFMIYFYKELIRTGSKYQAFHNARAYYQKRFPEHVNTFIMLD